MQILQDERSGDVMVMQDALEANWVLPNRSDTLSECVPAGRIAPAASTSSVSLPREWRQELS
jgi:hypothetical protein